MRSIRDDDVELRGGEQRVGYIAVVPRTRNERLELAPGEGRPHRQPERRETQAGVASVGLYSQVRQCNVQLARCMRHRCGETRSKRGEKQFRGHRTVVFAAGLRRFVDHHLETTHRCPYVVTALPHRRQSHSHGR